MTPYICMLSHTYLVTLIIHHIIFHMFGIFILHSHDVAVDYLLLLRVYCRCQVVLTICVEWSLLNVEALDFDCLISYIVLVGLFVHSFCQVHVLFCLQLWRRLDGQQKVRHQIDLKFVDLIFRLPIKLLKQRKFAYMYLSSKFECFPIYIYTELFFSRRSIQS